MCSCNGIDGVIRYVEFQFWSDNSGFGQSCAEAHNYAVQCILDKLQALKEQQQRVENDYLVALGDLYPSGLPGGDDQAKSSLFLLNG